MSFKPNMWARYTLLYRGTESEHALEPALASLGIPYRWQMPVGNYFLDFALPTLKVAIEVDGKDHRAPAKVASDRERTAWLEARGWKVVRCTNEEAVDNPWGTVTRLCKDAGVVWQAASRAAPSRPR